MERLLQALKTKKKKSNKEEKVEVLTLKEFLQVFEFDKFGHKACQLIQEEF